VPHAVRDEVTHGQQLPIGIAVIGGVGIQHRIDPTFRCITFPTSSAVAVTVGIVAMLAAMRIAAGVVLT